MTRTRHTLYVTYSFERRNAEDITDITNFSLWVPAFTNALDYGVVTVQDGTEVTITRIRYEVNVHMHAVRCQTL
jgi:hypothetical protein